MIKSSVHIMASLREESDIEFEVTYEEIDGELTATIYFSDDVQEREFTLDEDGNIIEEAIDNDAQQIGGGPPRYTIQGITQRNIPKFNVRGYEYNITIADMNGLEYTEAVQVLHHTLNRK